MTGLSGAGKSTLSLTTAKTLQLMGHATYVLDGDILREGLCKDLGYTLKDRTENARRVAEVSRLMVNAGVTVITALISPTASDRAFARSLFAASDFIEVYVDASLEVLERRDPKGLYKRARLGELKHFTGISSPYDPPLHPEAHIRTDIESVDACTRKIVEAATRKLVVGASG